MTPDQARALADAGPWAVVILMGAFFALAILKKWLVPGWLYDQERLDRQKADTQAERNTEAITKLTRAVDRLVIDVRASRGPRAPR